MQALAMQQQRSALMQQQQQQQMRRDPSGFDMNGQRPRTPSGGDHAPSPSKKPRIDGVPFNQQQMMPNGRPPPGMQPGMIPDNAQQASARLMQSGINPANLSETQFSTFQSQNPAVQHKSIQVYAQNLAKNQREGMSKASEMSDGGSPLMAGALDLTAGGQFYGGADAAQMMRNGAMPPNGGANGAGGNHALQDYQMQLMLLEQQNKKRLMMARQEQEAPGQPGIPAGYAQGMSPQGSRGGSSPGPGGERRGTPMMGQHGLPGSPLPDGSIRGSPAAMFNPMQPELYAQMNGGMRPPPNSNPAFNGQFNPQQMEPMRNAQARMPNGNWPQGPPGQPPMGQQPPNQQQPAQFGTPQQRNDMPPPQGPPPGAANGRPGSDDTPPTPQPSNKAAPKSGKKGDKKVNYLLSELPKHLANSDSSLLKRAPKATVVWQQRQHQKLTTLLQRQHHLPLSPSHIPAPLDQRLNQVKLRHRRMRTVPRAHRWWHHSQMQMLHHNSVTLLREWK